MKVKVKCPACGHKWKSSLLVTEDGCIVENDICPECGHYLMNGKPEPEPLDLKDYVEQIKDAGEVTFEGTYDDAPRGFSPDEALAHILHIVNNHPPAVITYGADTNIKPVVDGEVTLTARIGIHEVEIVWEFKLPESEEAE